MRGAAMGRRWAVAVTVAVVMSTLAGIGVGVANGDTTPTR
jgi:hypothetical protein